MKAIVIKSNHGNHTGFNRKWSLLNECQSLTEAKEDLINWSLDMSDDHIWRNGRSWDVDNKEYICTNGCTNFNYDGAVYQVITKNDIEAEFFNGGFNGYIPQFVIDFFDLTEYN